MGTKQDGLSGQYFLIFNFFFFCFVVAVFDLVHDVVYISPSLAANSIWKSFPKHE